MSLNVKTIRVGDKEFTLRLTSKALLSFNLKHGSEGASPVVPVLQAVSDLAARCDLFAHALTHPENKNAVKDGGQLLDLMADDPSWDNNSINELILELAHESGLLTEEDYLSLIDPVAQSGKQLINTLSRLLVGKPAAGSGDDVSGGDSEDTPT